MTQAASKFTDLAVTDTLFANSAAATSGDGSFSNPYRSLQAAVTAAAALGSVLKQKHRVQIIIFEGSAFDEDVVVPAGRHLAILGMGPWVLGDGVGNKFASTTPRSLTWNQDGAANASGGGTAHVTLLVGTYMPSIFSKWSSSANDPQPSYGTCAFISGDFIISQLSSGSNMMLHMQNVKVFGNVDGTSMTTNNVDLFLSSCEFGDASVGDFNMPRGRLQRAEKCVWAGATVTIQTYTTVMSCDLGNGGNSWTVASNTTVLYPQGFFNCFCGNGGITWNGGANFRVDDITEFYFLAGGIPIVGGNLVRLGGTVRVSSVDGTGGPLYDDITLSAGSGIALNQTGQNIEIAASGGSGVIMTEWNNNKTFTPNANFGTVTNLDFRYRRVGDTMEVIGYFKCGSTVGAEGYITLPNNIDTAKLNSAAGATLLGIIYEMPTSTGNVTPFSLFYDGSTADKIYIGQKANSSLFVKANGGIAGNNEGLALRFSYPVSGWTTTTGAT